MGQDTHGLLFGVRAPEGLALTDDDNLENDVVDDKGYGKPGLLDLWRRDRRVKRQRPDVGIVDHHADYVGDGSRLVGVWIAVGSSGIDGVPNTETTVRLRDIGTSEPYAKRLAWAKAEWEQFAEWAKGQGVSFEEPDVWFTTLEVS